MINAGDFRKGVTIEWENGVWSIVDFQHVSLLSFHQPRLRHSCERR